MGKEETREPYKAIEVKTYFLPEEELERLAVLFGTVIVKCGAEGKTLFVEFNVPHTNVRIVYYN